MTTFTPRADAPTIRIADMPTFVFELSTFLADPISASM